MYRAPPFADRGNTQSLVVMLNDSVALKNAWCDLDPAWSPSSVSPDLRDISVFGYWVHVKAFNDLPVPPSYPELPAATSRASLVRPSKSARLLLGVGLSSSRLVGLGCCHLIHGPSPLPVCAHFLDFVSPGSCDQRLSWQRGVFLPALPPVLECLASPRVPTDGPCLALSPPHIE